MESNDARASNAPKLLEYLQDHITLNNADGTILYSNATITPKLGYKAEEYIGQKPEAFVHPDDAEKTRAFFRNIAAETDATRTIELRGRHKLGHDVWLEVVTTNKLHDPQINAIITISRDISERRSAQAALAEERSLLRTLIDTLPDLIWVKDLQHRYVMHNAAHGNLLMTLASGSLIGKTDAELLPQQNWQQVNADEESIFKTGVPLVNHHEQLTDPDGNTIWVSTTRAPLRNLSGEIIGLAGATRDITERKLQEQQLRMNLEQEYAFQEALKALHEITIELTQIEVLDDFYRSVVELGRNRLGFDRLALFLYDPQTGAAIGTYGTDTEGKLSDERGVTFQPSPNGLMLRAFQREERFGYEEQTRLLTATKPSGTGWNAAAILWDGNQSQGWLTADNGLNHKPASKAQLELLALYSLTVGTLLARKKADVALKQSEALLRKVLESLPVGVWLLAPDGTITLSNPAGEQIWTGGWKAGPDRDGEFKAWWPESGKPLASGDWPADRAIHKGETSLNEELEIEAFDGTHKYVLNSAVPVRDNQDKILGAISVYQDITVLKLAENALREAFEKEKELGELKSRFVSMASHEFRTPLATILSSSEMMLNYRNRMDDEKINHRLTTIADQVKHLASIIEDVLDLTKMQSGRTEFKPVPTDLDALCREVLDEFRNRPDIRQTVRYECETTPTTIVLDRKLIRQVVINLIANATKYSEPETTVFVSLTYSDQDAVLRVRDQGIGIPEADLRHLFEPFHRAANVGSIPGTGLGLSITRQAVEMHGGTIRADTTLNVGTTFIVTLPLQPNADAQKPSSASG